jgi:hypothetical protein
LGLPFVIAIPKAHSGPHSYWFAAALVEVDRYPDDVAKWPVDLLVEIDAKVRKKTFINLSREIMDRIKNT